MAGPADKTIGIVNEPLSRVVNLVRSNRATTRIELSNATGLGRAVIRQRVAHAIELGLIEENGQGESTGGRTPRLLRFRNDAGLLAIVNLDTDRLRLAISDIGGRQLAETRHPWDISRPSQEALEQMVSGIRLLLNHKDVPKIGLWGVCVSVPGPVQFSTGRPVSPPIMPGWNMADIRGYLEPILKAPVWVDNDVNILALAEQASRHGAAAQNLVYIRVDSGVGAGIISGGELQRGADGAAGDIGHVAITDSQTRCRCGKIGCLEASVGEWALLQNATRAARSGESPRLASTLQSEGCLTAMDLRQAAEAGDPYMTHAFDIAAKTLGTSLASIINILNPKLVVVGGEHLPAGGSYIAQVREAVYRRSLPLATRNLVIETASSTVTHSHTGAAALITQQLFGQDVNGWIDEGNPAPYFLNKHAQRH